MRMHHILESELAAVRQRQGRPLDVVETGSIRSADLIYADDDGWSTLTLARGAEQHKDRVTSIDLDTAAAEKVLGDHGLTGKVTLVKGYSIDALAAMLATGSLVDVALLDSENDPQLILHEFMIARRMVRAGGLILVDDVDISSPGVRKGHLLLPWLHQHSTPTRLHQRSGPHHSTGVLAVDVD